MGGGPLDRAMLDMVGEKVNLFRANPPTPSKSGGGGGGLGFGAFVKPLFDISGTKVLLSFG